MSAQTERRERLHTAIKIARDNPAHLVAGDLNDNLLAVAAQAPRDATLVVLHSAVLTYVGSAERRRFVAQVSALPGHWISNEGHCGADMVEPLNARHEGILVGSTSAHKAHCAIVETSAKAAARTTRG